MQDLENDGPNRRGGKCRTWKMTGPNRKAGKCKTWNMTDQIAGLENAGPGK